MSVKLLREGVILAVLALIVFAVSFYLNAEPPADYTIWEEVAGVPVKSQIPFDSIADWKDVRLFESDDPTILSCNLELTAINQGTVYGLQQVVVEYGPQGIEVQPEKAFVRGQTSSELLQSCHVMACLIGGVDCPKNLFYAKGVVDSSDALRIVIDENASASVVGAYTELLGALSFSQSKRADADANGVVEEWEIKANRAYIMPYLNKDGECFLQPLNNLLQTTEGANESIDCSIIRGVYIKEGGENKIMITNDDRIILSGDQTHLLVEAIIVGNIIAPDWIVALHGTR